MESVIPEDKNISHGWNLILEDKSLRYLTPNVFCGLAFS